MSISIGSFTVTSRPRGRVLVKGYVSCSSGNNYSVVVLSGVRVNALAISDPSTGYFEVEIPVDPFLTTTVDATATNDLGTSSTVSASVSGPTLSATLGVTTSTNMDGTVKVMLGYSGTWTVDTAVPHSGVLVSILPQLNGARPVLVNSGTGEAFAITAWMATLPAGTYTGTRIELVVTDSWGFPHVAGCSL